MPRKRIVRPRPQTIELPAGTLTVGDAGVPVGKSMLTALWPPRAYVIEGDTVRLATPAEARPPRTRRP